MKRFVAVLLLIVVAVIAAPFLLQQDRPMEPITGLPWQVDVHADGTSSVFGFTLDRSTLGDARARFGEEMELGIIAAPGESGALEAYVSHFTAGVLTGKLILSTALPAETLLRMRRDAAHAEPTATGGIRFSLTREQLAQADQATITAITFVPSVNIDQETALQRFGTPAQRLRDDHGALHFLYPERGLDLMLNPEQKEVLQYVAPSRFEQLRRPLQAGPVQPTP